MQVLSPIGRVIFGIAFIIFGINHFISTEMLKGAVPLPPELLWLYISGVAMIAAGVSILMNKLTKISSLLLGILLLLIVFTIQLPKAFKPDAVMMSWLPGFLKDLTLAAAAFFISGYSAQKEVSKSAIAEE